MTTDIKIFSVLDDWSKAVYNYFTAPNRVPIFVPPPEEEGELSVSEGCVRNFNYNFDSADPTVDVITKCGFVSESDQISLRSGKIYQHTVDFGGMFKYDIYPLQNKRFVRVSSYKESGSDIEHTDVKIVLGDEIATTVRQLERWKYFAREYPFKVDEENQTITIGETMVPVVSTEKLSYSFLAVIGLGLSGKNFESVVKSPDKPPFMVLVARNGEEMATLCKKTNRCKIKPETTTTQNSMILTVSGAFDVNDNLFTIYTASFLIGQTISTIHHEMWHSFGERFIANSDIKSLRKYDGFFTNLLSGMLTAVGYPEWRVSRLLYGVPRQYFVDDIKEFSVCWEKYFSDESSGFPMIVNWFTGDVPFPHEWYALLGTCVEWNQKCRETLSSVYAPMVYVFDIQSETTDAANVRGVLKKIDVTNNSSQNNTYAPIKSSRVGPEKTVYYLGPYSIETDGSKKLLSLNCDGAQLQFNDPGFQKFLEQYDFTGDLTVENIPYVEGYIRMLSNCGGPEWKQKTECLDLALKTTDLTEIHKFNWGNNYASLSRIFKLANKFASGSEDSKDVLASLNSECASYIGVLHFMNIDSVDKDVDLIVKTLREVLDRDKYNQFVLALAKEVMERIIFPSYEPNDVKEFAFYFLNKLFGNNNSCSCDSQVFKSDFDPNECVQN